jgi:hypothetical protein
MDTMKFQADLIAEQDFIIWNQINDVCSNSKFYLGGVPFHRSGISSKRLFIKSPWGGFSFNMLIAVSFIEKRSVNVMQIRLDPA